MAPRVDFAEIQYKIEYSERTKFILEYKLNYNFYYVKSQDSRSRLTSTVNNQHSRIKVLDSTLVLVLVLILTPLRRFLKGSS